MSKYQVDSRDYWRRLAAQRQFIINKLDTRIKELEADYDLVETELRTFVRPAKDSPE